MFCQDDIIKLEHSKPLNIYPSPQKLDKQHVNEIYVQILYTYDKNNNRQILNKYILDTVCDERKQDMDYLIKQDSNTPVCDLKYYLQQVNNKVSNYKILSNYKQSVQYKTKRELNSLSKQEVVFIDYEIIQSVGCQHYICGCEQQCPTCGKFYGCRQCHNNEQDHTMDRQNISHIRCRKCQTIQELNINKDHFIKQSCVNCHFPFFTVCCEKCKFMCYISQDSRPSFHCDKCQTCLVGYRKDFTHCDKCNRCVYKIGFEQHICKSIEEEVCCVCLQPFCDSVFALHTMSCGHTIHSHCHNQILDQGDLKCPICKKYSVSPANVVQITQNLKQAVKNELLDIYDQISHVKCNECQCKFYQKTRMFKLYQCPNCGLFNTELLDVIDDQQLDWQISTLETLPDCGIEFIPLPQPTLENIAHFIAFKFYQKDADDELIDRPTKQDFEKIASETQLIISELQGYQDYQYKIMIRNVILSDILTENITQQILLMKKLLQTIIEGDVR